MSLLNVSFDAGPLERWAEELSTKGLRNAIRRAVDQSARAARKATIDVIAKDIGTTKAKIREATPRIKPTTQGNLTATFTATKMRLGILNTSGATVSRYGGLSASTHRLGGGGSSSLSLPKAFIVTSGSGRYVAFRTGTSRTPIKAVYGEHPGTALGQPNSPAQKAWVKSGQAEMAARLPREVQRQFYSERLSASTPDTGD